MKTKLLFTTALVAVTFAGSNVCAEDVETEYYNSEKSIVDNYDKHVTGKKKDRIFISGETDIEGNEATLGSFVTLGKDAKIKGGEDGTTKKLTVKGYLTVDKDSSGSNADISGVDLYMEKGHFDREENAYEGELVLGDDLTVGNVYMGEGTNLFLNQTQDGNETKYKLEIADDKEFVFEGDNKIYGGKEDGTGSLVKSTELTFAGKDESEGTGGTVVNKGKLTAEGLTINAQTDIVNESAGSISAGSIKVDKATVTNDGEIELAGGLETTDGATVVNNKEITAKEINTKGKLVNNGTITANGDSDGEGTGEIQGFGTVVMGEGAKINGNVNMDDNSKGKGTLEFAGDNSLSAISGTIKAQDIKVTKGTLTYDKEATGKITVGTEDTAAGLDIGTQEVKNYVDLKKGSSLTIHVDSGDDGSVKNGKINGGSGKLTAEGENSLKLFIDEGVDAGTLSELNLGDSVEEALKSSSDGKLTLDTESNMVYNMEITEDGKIKAIKNSASQVAEKVAEKVGSSNVGGVAGAFVAESGLTGVGAAIHEAMYEAAQDSSKIAIIKELAEDAAPSAAPVVQTVETNQLAHAYDAVRAQLNDNGINTAAVGKSSEGGIIDRASVWVKTLFNKSTLDDTSKAKGFDAETKGVAFGAQKEVSDDVTAGVAYAYGETDVDGYRRSVDVDSHTFMLYGKYQPSNWYVDGIASYGMSAYKEHRATRVGRVDGKYDADVYGLQAMTGYETGVADVNVAPEAGLRYARINQESYTDGAGQHVKAKDQDILTAVAGVKAGKDVALDNGMKLRPEARLAMTYDLADGDNSAVVNLGSSSYRIEGEELERFGVEAGLGLTASINDSWDITAGYEGRFRKDFEDHAGLISAKYKF